MHFDLPFVAYGLALLGAGLACGLINTLASSGSAISLPVLMMLGLSPISANATNRLPVLFGSLMALNTFERNHQVNWRAGLMVAIPATLGSIAGVLAAEKMPRRDMALIITAAVLIALLLLFTKLHQIVQQNSDRSEHITVSGLLAMLGVGFWLGFIVLDGATYLLLVLILMLRFDLVRANALKVLLLVATTLVPIAMFARAGNIRWTEGLLMSAGSLAGGYLGAHLTMQERAKFWVFRILVVVLSLEIVHLGIQYGAPYLWSKHLV
jgi:uncharacterized protein